MEEKKVDVKDENIKDDNVKEQKKSEKDNRSFCFCLGEQVDCLPGVVLDCNNKRTKKCPLTEEKGDKYTAEELTSRIEKHVHEREKEMQEKHKDDKKTEKKEKERAFCFCLGARVDCLPGVVLDCNNKRTRECPLVKEVLSVNEEKEKQVKELKEKFKNKKKQTDTKEEESAKKDTKEESAKGEDGKKSAEDNVKKEEKKEKDGRSFCFCLGEQVDCLPGVVLDCNNKRTKKCPLTEEKGDRYTAEELTSRIEKHVHEREKEMQEKHKDDKKPEKKEKERAFCFCLGARVDCLPGVVLDCNNKRTKECPLVKEVLSVNEEKEKQVKEMKAKFKDKKKKEREEIKKREQEETQKKEQEDAKKESAKVKEKDGRSFCFCLGSQVNCTPGIVLDCNNKHTKICPVLLEALPVEDEKKLKIKEIRAMFDNRE